MSFYKKYELQRLIHEFDAKVFRAVQNSTGAQVLLHVFPATDAAREVVAESQRRIEAGGAIELIETGEFAGSMYVVTVPIDGIENLRTYLQAAKAGGLEPSPPRPTAAPPVAPPRTAPPPAPAASAIPPTPGLPPPAPQVPPRAQAPAQEAATLPLDRPISQPKRRTTQVIVHGPVTVNTNANAKSTEEALGEFTRMFGSAPGAPAPVAKASPAPPPLPAAAPAAPAAREQEIGEFTRMFHPETALPPPAYAPPAPAYSPPPAEPSPAVQRPPAAPPPRARDKEMDDFEKIFGPAGGNPFPSDEPAKPTRPESPLPAWPQAPSPVTHPSISQPAISQHGMSQPGVPPKDSEFTKFFGSSFHGAEIDIEQEHKRAAAEPKSETRRPFQQASEFTRMFGTDDPAKHQPHAPVRLNEQTHASTMFGSPKQLQDAAASLTAGTDSKAGPSEYTRLIGGVPGPSAPGAGLNEDSASLKSGAVPAVTPPAAGQVAGQQVAPAPGGSKIGLYIAVAAIVLSLLAAIVLLLKSR